MTNWFKLLYFQVEFWYSSLNSLNKSYWGHPVRFYEKVIWKSANLSKKVKIVTYTIYVFKRTHSESDRSRDDLSCKKIRFQEKISCFWTIRKKYEKRENPSLRETLLIRNESRFIVQNLIQNFWSRFPTYFQNSSSQFFKVLRE